MALSNSERQALWRKRREHELATLRAKLRTMGNQVTEPPFDKLLIKLLKMQQSENEKEREVAVHKTYQRMKKLKIKWDDLVITKRRG